MQEFEENILIDQYLNGELSGKALHEFETRLASDKQLADELALQRITNTIIFENRLGEIREKINLDLSNPDPSFRNIIIGMGVGILICVGLYSLWTKETPQTPVLTQKEKITKVSSPSQLPDSKAPVTTTTSNPLYTKSSDLKAEETKTVTTSEPTTNTINLDPVLVKTESEQPQHTVAENEIKREEKITTASDPCSGSAIKAKAIAIETCLGENNGTLRIQYQSVKGGKSPYRYSLDGKEFSSNGVFTHLAAGTYTLHILDQNNCTAELNEKIESKRCIGLREPISFSPGRGDYCRITNEQKTGAELKIYNRAGIVLTTAHLEPGQIFEWEGKSTTGENLTMGSYLYTMQYENGTTEQGTITIVQ